MMIFQNLSILNQLVNETIKQSDLKAHLPTSLIKTRPSKNHKLIISSKFPI
jgi:hypothetical protein